MIEEALHRSKPGIDSDLKKYVTRILKVSKKRALENTWGHNLDREWLFNRLSNGVCEVSGLPLVFDHKFSDKQSRSPWGPSIDRIDSKKGYTKSNSRIVCNIYNLMKSTGDDDHVLQICMALLKRDLHAGT